MNKKKMKNWLLYKSNKVIQDMLSFRWAASQIISPPKKHILRGFIPYCLISAEPLTGPESYHYIPLLFVSL